MSDKVSLIIAGRKIENFSRYQVSSDLFEAADAFSFDLADPDIKVQKGQRCQLKVNGILELNGIIDKVNPSYDKKGRKLCVEGRDLMGLVVDSCCTTYPDLQDITLKDLAKLLLKDIPYINRSAVRFGKGDKARAVEVTAEAGELKWTQIKPGQTVFEVLKQKALEQGMLFFSLPDGTFMFGQPVTGGKARFHMTTNKKGLNNTIMSATLNDDISRRYKTVTVMGQKQGSDNMDPGMDSMSDQWANFEGIATDASFPFTKPYVATVEHDGQDPNNYAHLIMDGMQFASWCLEIKTFAHSQNGRNYQVNAVYHVKDEVLGVNADLLCYGRTFEMGKDGVFTTLRLSKLGVMPTL